MTEKDDINDFELPGGGMNPDNEGFKLPDGYFNSFSAKLFNKIELENELKEFSILSSLEKKNAFLTPPLYFEASSPEIANKLEVVRELESYPKLSSLNKVYPGFAPEGYFNESEQLLDSRIAALQEINEFEILSSLSKLNCFALPENYFDTVLDSVRAIIYAPKELTWFEKLTAFVFSRKVAYAFGVVVIAVFSLFFYMNEGNKKIQSDCGQLACLDKKEIFNSAFINQLDEETISGMIDEEALSDSLSQKNSSAENELLENVDVSSIIDEL